MKKEGLTLSQLGSRCHNFIEKLSADLEQTESLIFNLLEITKSIPIEETAELINQLYELSKCQDIPPTQVPKFVKQKIEEKNKIEEIRKSHRNLEQKNIEIQTIDEYRKLEEELQKYGLSMEFPPKLVSVLLKINRLEYDALKILKELA